MQILKVVKLQPHQFHELFIDVMSESLVCLAFTLDLSRTYLYINKIRLSG